MLALLVSLACSPADDADDDTGAVSEFASPDAYGPWGVTTWDTVVTSTTGVDLPVQVWAPTKEAAGSHRYDGLIEGVATEDAAPDCADVRPVMMFSHGSGGMRYQSIFWTEYLASHGWVVAAPDHVGNTVFDDGSVPLIEMAMRRPVDIRDTFDWLVGTDAGGELAGCLDPDGGYDMSGHSFGAYTTLILTGTVIDVAATAAYCASHDEWLCDDLAGWAAEHPDVTTVDLTDARARTGIPMSPAGYEVLVGGLAGNVTPMLTWVGTRDELTPLETQVRPIYEDLGGSPVDLAVITDAGHYTFSDACELAPIFEDCAPPYLDAEIAHPLIRTVSLAFLQALRGSEAANAWLPPDDPLLTWEER